MLSVPGVVARVPSYIRICVYVGPGGINMVKNGLPDIHHVGRFVGVEHDELAGYALCDPDGAIKDIWHSVDDDGIA